MSFEFHRFPKDSLPVLEDCIKRLGYASTERTSRKKKKAFMTRKYEIPFRETKTKETTVITEQSKAAFLRRNARMHEKNTRER